MLNPSRLSRMVMPTKVKKLMLLIDSLNKTKIKLSNKMTEMIMMKDQDLQVLNQEMLTNKVIKIQVAVTRQEGPGNHQEMIEAEAEMVLETMVEVDSTVVI